MYTALFIVGIILFGYLAYVLVKPSGLACFKLFMKCIDWFDNL